MGKNNSHRAGPLLDSNVANKATLREHAQKNQRLSTPRGRETSEKRFCPSRIQNCNFPSIPLPSQGECQGDDRKSALKFNDSDPENSSSTWEGEKLSAVTKVKVAGKEVDALLDTGASVNLINLSTIHELHRYLKLEKYDGRLETEDGRQMAAVGPARVRRLVGTINGVVNFLVMHDVNPTIILGLAFLNNHKANLDFNTKLFWTGPEEGSIAGFRVEQNRRIRGLRDVTREASERL